MDTTSFRMRFRKEEGVIKKGPLVVKHPPSHTNNCSAISNFPQNKELRSPIGQTPILLGRRRPLSPDPRNGIRRASINIKETEPQKALKLRHNRERSNSPTNRRHAILRGTLSGPIPKQNRTQASPPTKRYTPPSSPRIRRPVSPRTFSTQTESVSRTGPMKCFPVLPKLPTPSEEKRPPSPASSRPSSPSNRRPASPRGTSPRGRGASPGSKPPPISEEELKLKVQRAQKARLYLLHQPGPNSFSIGSESPCQKYKVIIGQQTCSCGHGPYCVHVLFVMIRVLKLPDNDPLLMTGNLKDYEVEQLLRSWEDKRKKAVQARERRTLYNSGKDRIPGRMNFKRSPPASPTSTLSASYENCSDESQCPICLMNMVRGESLVVCETGCRNYLHHHCMSVWAADRHEQNQPLLCPLCRAPWSSRIYPRMKTRKESAMDTHGIDKEHLPTPMSVSFSANGSFKCGTASPSMTRSMSSACHDAAYTTPCFSDGISKPFSSTPLYGHGYPPTVRGEISAPLIHTTSDELVPLPYTDPIPTEHASVASSWVSVFGAELVACLFSRDWVVRETGLRRLAHEVTKALRWDYLVTTEKVRKNIIRCCANILAQVANDPVYKVYIACLRCVKVLFSHLCPIEESETCELQSHFRPLLHTLLLKCADGNRRTSQISLDFLVELSRGQRGELALSTSARGLGAISYVLSCILDATVPSETPWQWLLGRLCVLDRLLDEFPCEFQLQMVKLSPGDCGYKLQHYDRLMTVVEFAFKALGSRHTTVAKLARRIYICGARMAAVEPAVFNQVCDMLAKLDVSLQARLKQRLRSMQTSHGEKRSSYSRFGHRLAKENQLTGSRLVRSVSHSPSRMLSALRSSSPNRYHVKETLTEKPEIQQKPVILRPNHLPLNSIDPLFKEKQHKVRLYQKHRTKQELPLIVQQALLSPNHKMNKAVNMQKVNSFVKASLSQNNSDSINGLNPFPPPRTNRLHCLLKDVIGTPDTPSAPYSTPVKDWRTADMMRISEKESPLPPIPYLHLIPKYLDYEADPHKMSIADTDYEEGKDWIKGPLIGTGAFSSCFQGRDTQTGTLMAVKQISICRNDEEEQERVEAAIEDEILMMSKLQHQNVVRLFGATRMNTSFSVFSEWMAGGSVAAMLEKFGAFSDQVIIKYTNQILMGLSYLHDNMILHRDLKGANLLVDSTGKLLRIGDFGTAARLANKTTITGEFQGQLLGTIAFMAPEVLRGDNYGRACDVWSIGCCIIEMATTKPPWGADHVSNQYKLMFRIATSTIPPHIPDSLSPFIKDMTFQCLQISSEKRPSTKSLLNHQVFHNLPP